MTAFAVMWCLFLFAPFPEEASAQEVADHTVQGTVTDGETGEPIPGVNVLVEETTVGTTTNNDGEYELTAPSDDVVLAFSFVGYETQRVAVAGQDVIDVSLGEDLAMLNEVVIVGFGTQDRSDVTGAVSSISAADIEERPLTNTALGLQGMSPGLTIQYEGGQPGAESAVARIRGTSTLNNPNPLVLVDGVEQPLRSVESSNIESISVLKDAASAAIYGSRAANGVILIETKRGPEAGVVVNYDTHVGMQDMLGFPEGASKEDWMRLRNEAAEATGASPDFSEEYIENVLAGTNPLEYPWADFEGAVFRENAVEHDHSLSISAGGEIGRVYAALSHTNTEGVMKNFSNRRTALRVNSDLYVTDGLTFQANLLYRNGDVAGPGFTAQRITQALLHMNRDMLMSYPDGQDATGDLIGGTWNPYIMGNSGESSRLSDDIVGTAGIDYQISSALSLEADVTLNRTTTEEMIFRESRNGMIHYVTGEEVAASAWFSTNTLQEGRYNRRELSQRAFLNFEDDLGANHSLGGVVGYEEIYTRATQVSAARSDFFNDDLRLISSGDSGTERTCQAFNDPGDHTGSCFNDRWRVRSFFGRANYSYDNRYSLQANVRYDGSSRFAEGNRWGFFPSFSAGWSINNEAFMQDVDLFSNLRLRASWGQLGNERSSSNERSGLFSYLNSYNLGLSYQFEGGPAPAAAVTSAGNPDIGWETTTMTNVGLDVGFLDNRIEVIAEYFRSYTSDILLNLPIPATVGLGAPEQNAGEVSNKGWELAVNYHSAPATDRGFEYSVGIQLSDVVNTIESLNDAGPFYPDKFTVWAEGHSINSLRGFPSPGIYRTEGDFEEYPEVISDNVDIGDIIYEDLNGDGELTPALYPDGDQYVMANEDPRYEFGVNFSASYRGFDFTMFWQGVMQQYHTLDGALNEGPNNQNYIPAVMAREAFHPERNPDGTWPRVITGNTWNMQETDFWLQDTKYARLKNIQLGYTIPQELITNIHVYVSGENILTFTPTELFDPETPRGRSQFFPHRKMVSVGMSATF